MMRFPVVHSVHQWLPQTETWLYQQVRNVPPEDRPAHRAQALEWLRADLEGWRELLAAGRIRPARLAQILQGLKTEADLAGTREPKALGKLPEEERKAWQDFWQEIEIFLGELR